MALFELTLALLFGSVVLAGLARKVAAPYPAFLALAGAALAFLPNAPVVEIEPDLALALFVAPVLLDAAFDTSPRDLRRYAAPLISLVLVAVLLTTAAVAYVGWRLGLPIASSVAIGAIVAPPDAVAAVAVLSQLRPPRRTMAILQSESLLNDATALLIYRAAVTAAAGSVALAQAGPIFIFSALGSLALGYFLAAVFRRVGSLLRDAASGTVIQFVSTFGVWILADRLGLSAVITMVVYAMTLARAAPRRLSARNRISSYSVWETAVFVLNVLAFVLMGLQARPILERLTGDSRAQALALAAAALAAAIFTRLAWVLGSGAATRALRRLLGVKPEPGRDVRSDLLIGWCGMRGLITVAAALALPAGFPGRDPIVLAAFCVVLGTLVIQGLTLRPLMSLLGLEEDRSVEAEVSRARVAIMQAALETLEGENSTAAAAVREFYGEAKRVAENSAAPQATTDFDELRLRAIERQRKKLNKLRADDAIGDEAYHRLQEEIDWAELDAAPAGRFQPLMT
jgi:CPA1 family monovalent cation:H+ antiporter